MAFQRIDGLQWTAFNFLTGQVILDSAEIAIDANSEMPLSIGQMETISVQLNLSPNTPAPDWIYATEKGAAGWVAWTGDPLNPTILWGGVVSQRIRGLGPMVQLELSTPEFHLDQCPMGAYSASSVNQDTILSQIVTQFAASVTSALSSDVSAGSASVSLTSLTNVYAGQRLLLDEANPAQAEWVTVAASYSGSNPVPLAATLAHSHLSGAVLNNMLPNWQLIPSGTPSTATQTVSYLQQSNISVLGALQALSSVSGGPEWMTGWQWNLINQTIFPMLTYGQRIGRAANPTPNVTIELGDLREGSEFAEDYTSGRGANQIVALGASNQTANGGVLPSATTAATNLNGRPVCTFVYTPNSQVTDPNTLAYYAVQALTAMQDGIQPIVAVFDINQPGKAFGVDWFIGDDIGWSLGGPGSNPDGTTPLQFPIQVTGVGRVIGAKVTQSTVAPVISGAKLS